MVGESARDELSIRDREHEIMRASNESSQPERQETEEALAWELKVAKALAQAYPALVSPSSSIMDIAHTILVQAKALTGSVHGYVSSLDPDTGDHIGHTLTEMLAGQCQVSAEKRYITFSRGKDGRYGGLWGHALNTRQGFYTNEPQKHPASSGVPQGHVPLERFLSVPVLLGHELVGQIALANPPQDYTDRDLTAIARLAEFYALAIQRQRVEDALRDREIKLRGLIEHSPDGIALCDERGRVIEWNPAQERISGLSRSEALGRPLWDLQFALMTDERKSAASYERLRGIMTEFLRTGEGSQSQRPMEVEVKRPDGSRTFMQNLGFTIRTEIGFMIGNLARDVTDRRRAEAEIRHLSSFPQLNPNPVLEVNAEGRIIFQNEASRLSLQELGLEDPYVFLPPDMGENLERAKRSGASHWDQEVQIGENTFGETIHFVPDTNTVRLYITDISERCRAEEERAQLQAQLQQAQKLESLGILAGGIAHDFNNLLTTILGNVELALMDLTPYSPARPSLEEIRKAAQRASELSGQMLAYSGRGRFVVGPVNLSDLVRETGGLLKASLSSKALLQYDLAADLPQIVADAAQLRQVVRNLVTNAAEALGDGEGTITLRTRVMDVDRQYLAQTYVDEKLPAGRYVSLEVSDTGCGMDEATEARVFEPFFSTKFVGRGLGLPAVLGIVRGHKGAIRVESAPREGARFTVLFPCSE